MPFLGAISSGNLQIMRGTSSVEPSHAITLYLSACPNTNIYTARINQSSFTSPIVDLTYDGGAGTLANVEVGMTVLISATNDKSAAYFRGRVRKSPTANELYINETDGKQFSNNDYIFVIDDYALHEKLARDVNGTLYPDWDTAFRETKPVISNLRSGYADWVSSGVYTISFAPDVVASKSGASISSYLWDVQDGTITVGNATTKNITVTFPAGHRWVVFTATDDNGVSQTRYIPVWAHDPSSYPPQILEAGAFSVTATIEEGYNASVSAFDGVDAILDNTLVCAWADEVYNGTAQHIDNNIVMIGRFRSEANQTEFTEEGNRDDSVTFTIEGTLTQLSRLRVTPMEISSNVSADEFNEIAYLTIWRAIHLILTEYCTFSELHSIEYGETSKPFLYPLLITAGQDIKTSVMDLADSINAVIQESRTGECEIARKAVYLTTADRNALATVISATTTDILDTVEYSKDHGDVVGIVRGDGGGYDANADTLTAFLVSAPAGAPGTGVGENELRRQVLESNITEAEAITELTQRAGNAYAEAQNRTTLALSLPSGYWFLVPDTAAWYKVIFDGTETTRGIVLTSSERWILSTIDTVFDNELGYASTTITLLLETEGEEGEIIYLPDAGTDEFPITMGDFDAPIDIPSTFDDTITYDFETSDGDLVALIGTHSPGDGWEPDCVGGTSEYLDLYVNFSEAITITSVSVIYDAVYAGGADGQNQFITRLTPGDWTGVHSFTTETGSDVQETADFGGGIVATSLRLIMYAGGSDCTGSLLLKSFTYTKKDETPEKVLSYDFTLGQQGWDFFSPNSTIYVAGEGWADDYPTKPGDGIDIISPVLSVKVLAVRLYMDSELTGSDPGCQFSDDALSFTDTRRYGEFSYREIRRTWQMDSDQMTVGIESSYSSSEHFTAKLQKVEIVYQ